MTLPDPAEDSTVPHPADPLERLARVEVPPVPTAQTFTAGVRRKLHPRLLALHVLQFAFGATAWAVIHFVEALGAAVRYTLTGTWPGRGPRP
ncbi:MAG: hypothetical protein EBR28_02580 [Planctomycetia bacterium]|nr:hypothetical protein [Planctomycetia bacterium]